MTTHLNSINLGAQRLNLHLQCFIFLQLALQEAGREPGFGYHPAGCEQVGVFQLVRVTAEVVHFHPALFHQGTQAVVQAAQADAQLLGHLALVELRAFFQQPQYF